MEIDSQTHEQNDQHTVTIWEIKPERLAAMKRKLSNTQKVLPSEGAGQESCSIYKVPENLINNNGELYEPRIVSIGPWYHCFSHLHMFQKHKWRFLDHMLNRTKSTGKVLEDYLMAVQPLERKARMCYYEAIAYSSDDFIEMMVLDACFIIELFRKCDCNEDDPILSSNRINSFFLSDLMRLENQIPYFILKCLFELTKPPESPTLTTLALKFFNHILYRRPQKVLEKSSNIEANHLLDLLQQSFLTQELRESTKSSFRPNIIDLLVGMQHWNHIIHNISKLRRSGIQLKTWNEAETFLLVEFKNGVIHMPTITIDDFMCTFLLNSVAFEQCHSGCSKHYTAYVTLLDCLINTSKDVELLCDWNIIENYLGTDGEVATFINNIGKDISFAMDDCYHLVRLFCRVSRHYHNRWHVHCASFMNTYFNTPWSFLSALAALVLLILTFTQTFYAVLSYARPP